MQLLTYLNLRFWRCCLSWEWCPTNRAISGWHNTNWSKLQNVLVCNNLVLVCTAAPPLSFSILKVDTAAYYWGEATLPFGTKHVKTSITAFLVVTLTSRVKFQYFSHDAVAWHNFEHCFNLSPSDALILLYECGGCTYVGRVLLHECGVGM